MSKELRLGSVSLERVDPHELALFFLRILQTETAYDVESFAALQLENLWLTFQRVTDYCASTWPDPGVSHRFISTLQFQTWRLANR